MHDMLPLSLVQVGYEIISGSNCNGPLNVNLPLDLHRWNRRKNTW